MARYADVAKNNADAEIKFKEINEANEVLSNTVTLPVLTGLGPGGDSCQGTGQEVIIWQNSGGTGECNASRKTAPSKIASSFLSCKLTQFYFGQSYYLIA